MRPKQEEFRPRLTEHSAQAQEYQERSRLAIEAWCHEARENRSKWKRSQWVENAIHNLTTQLVSSMDE
jgi:hypothetical protein